MIQEHCYSSSKDTIVLICGPTATVWYKKQVKLLWKKWIMMMIMSLNSKRTKKAIDFKKKI